MSMILRVAALVALLMPARATAQRPNVILIITDDVGYADFGSYGARDVKTPNIDRLARQGVRMTDFYATPMCTPTRAMLITGRYQQRVSLERALGSVGPSLEQGLPATGRSLPQLLKNNGYATGLIGKWHLGYKPEYSPNAHGFDYFYGFLSGYIDFYHHIRGDGAEDLWENTTAVHDSGYMTDLITARSVRFIEQNAARPFFLEIAYNAAHWPFQRPDHPTKAAGNAGYQNPYDSVPPTRADYVAMIERADRGVGEVLALLERRGLARNTLVIFTNDNGGEWLSDNSPFFNRKQTLWEGGIRVPAIFRWPARLPAGKTVREPAIMMDVTASILAATGAPAPTDPALEGRDILPVLAGTARGAERMLFWRYFSTTRQHRAVRRGDWKLLIDGEHAMLFNLRTDPGERHDLARSRPDLVRVLRQAILDWEKDVDEEAARTKR